MRNISGKSFGDIAIIFAKTLINLLVPTIFGLTILVFLFGIYKFIASADSEDERENGKKFMFYGIIGIFFMLSVWGFVQILTNTFELRFGIPQIKTSFEIIRPLSVV